MAENQSIQQYYDRGSLRERLEAALAADGLDGRVLAPEDLAPLDQFHSRGLAATVELADALDIEPITLCRMIDRLEEAGLVERRRDDADRRAWRIHLTKAAAPVIAKLEAMGVGFNADILAGIDDAERETTIRVLARIRHNLDQIDQELEQAS